MKKLIFFLSLFVLTISAQNPLWYVKQDTLFAVSESWTLKIPVSALSISVGSDTYIATDSASIAGVIYTDGTNVGINTPTPHSLFSLGSSTGMKLAIYDGTGTDLYGFGIQASLFEFIVPSSVADFAFGYGTSGSLTKLVTIDSGTGILDVNGGIEVSDDIRIDVANRGIEWQGTNNRIIGNASANTIDLYTSGSVTAKFIQGNIETTGYTKGYWYAHADSNGYFPETDDVTLFLNGAPGSNDIFLPAGAMGKHMVFFKTDTTANNIILYPDGTETINFKASDTLFTKGDMKNFIFNSVDDNWYLENIITN